MRAGATYAGTDYKNHFRLIRRPDIAKVTAEVSIEYGLPSEATDFLILRLATELSNAQIELNEAKEKAEKLAQDYREMLTGLEEQAKRYPDFESFEGE